MFGKNINILYNYDTNFYHVIKMSIIFGITAQSLFELSAILMRVRNPKTTINNKVRATEQKIELDPFS